MPIFFLHNLHFSQASDFVGTEYYSYVAYTVLFLAVQQFAENLRQSAHFKKRTWQYLGVAIPNIHLEGVRFEMHPSNAAWATFCGRCQEVRAGKY